MVLHCALFFPHGAAPCKENLLESSIIFSHGTAPCEKFCTVPHPPKNFSHSRCIKATFFTRCSAVQKKIWHFSVPCEIARHCTVRKSSPGASPCMQGAALGDDFRTVQHRPTETWLENFIDNSDLQFRQVVNTVVPYKALRHKK